MTLWRTTKIPEFYFTEIEKAVAMSKKYVSVSEFIRLAIEELLSKVKPKQDFLLIKDIIFTETRITQIHELIAAGSKMDSTKLLKKDFQQVIDQSLDIDLITFLAKFMQNFAKYHPFEDGNKRTALITVDSFLRLNNLKLKLTAKKAKETADEIFFWQNSAQQRTVDEIKRFIDKHLVDHQSTNDVDNEIAQSIKDNKLMLDRLSR